MAGFRVNDPEETSDAGDYCMEIWVEVRRRVLTGELSKRAACREYEIPWQTLEKIHNHSEPPGYQKTKPRSSVVDAFAPIIEEILKSDPQVHRKQRHTARRIFGVLPASLPSR